MGERRQHGVSTLPRYITAINYRDTLPRYITAIRCRDTLPRYVAAIRMVLLKPSQTHLTQLQVANAILLIACSFLRNGDVYAKVVSR